MAIAAAKVAKTSNRGSRAGERRGGRTKGVPNKANAARTAAIVASGLTPLDYMLTLLRDEKRADDERFEAAKAAAPYVHAKLAAVDATVNGNMSFTIVVNKP